MPNLGRGRVGACQQKTLGDRSSLCNNGTGQATSHPPSSLVSQRHPRPLLFCLPCSQGKDLSHVGLDFPASLVPFLVRSKVCAECQGCCCPFRRPGDNSHAYCWQIATMTGSSSGSRSNPLPPSRWQERQLSPQGSRLGRRP